MKMKKIATAVALLAGLGISSAALAGTQATLKVTGKIAPPACDISFDGGGTLDWASIDRASLAADKDTELAAKKTMLNVSCESPTQFAIKATDIAEKAGEANLNGKKSDTYFSLGKTGGDKIIGGYQIGLAAADTTVDGSVAKAIIFSADGGKTWNGNQSKIWGNNVNTPDLETLSNGSINVPISMKTLAMNIKVTPWVSATSKINTADEITLAGNATFDIIYL